MRLDSVGLDWNLFDAFEPSALGKSLSGISLVCPKCSNTYMEPGTVTVGDDIISIDYNCETGCKSMLLLKYRKGCSELGWAPTKP